MLGVFGATVFIKVIAEVRASLSTAVVTNASMNAESAPQGFIVAKFCLYNAWLCGFFFREML
jgi:hypothetical protein